uniref:Protein sleepless n=1 Tax=Pristionchus pacificus TaxID=54126 RepID=A0A8R1YVW6_PRIPA
MRHLLPSLLISTILPILIFGTVTVKCYSCITPKNGANFDQLCLDDSFCEGIWCTKGPDETSSGVLHGCSNVVPLDRAASACKDVNQAAYNYSNCYCNNIDYCNSDNLLLSQITSILILCLFLLRL